MKLSKKTIIISSIIIISLVVLISVMIMARGKINKPENLLKELKNSVDLQIKGFVYTEVGDGKAKWEVKAETATYDKKQNLVVLELVKIKLMTSDGRVYLMKADKGRIITDEKNVEINGNVVISSNDGDRFSTDYIKYNNNEKKFYTDAPVIMENKKMKMTGNGLTIFMKKGELNIPSMVRARIN
jgi:LPS export ABC transporter protein LptC